MQLPGEFSPFIEKKWFFAQWSGGLPPPIYTLSGPTTKKTLFFMCVFPQLGVVLVDEAFHPQLGVGLYDEAFQLQRLVDKICHHPLHGAGFVDEVCLPQPAAAPLLHSETGAAENED